jgi:phage terminase large subunit
MNIEKLLKDLGAIEKESVEDSGYDCKFLKELTPLQKKIIKDPALYKALLLGRRSGKSYVIAAKLLEMCLVNNNSSALFISLTNTTAYKILWRILRSFVSRYNLPCKFNETKHTVSFENGSEITILGCDNLRDTEKLRGLHFELICVDEAGAFQDHLQYLIDEVLSMALQDNADSELWLSGTPNRTSTGYFHRATTEENSPFKTWTGTVFDNPKFPRWAGKKNWKKLAKDWLAEYLLKKNCTEEDNAIQREVFARWIKDTDKMVIDLDWDRNTYSQLPPIEAELHYLMGVDIGIDDPFSIVTGAYSPFKEYKGLYIVDIFSQTNLITEDAIAILKEKMDIFNPQIVVCDPGGGGKRFQSDFNAKYGVSMVIKPASKQEKIRYCDELSNDSKQGNIKFSEHLKVEFEEMKQLVWKDKEKNSDIRTTKTLRDDNYDALQYLYRHYMINSNSNREMPVKMSEQDVYWEQMRHNMQQNDKRRRRLGL